MEINSLHLKNYRTAHRLALVAAAIIIAGCWWLVLKEHFLLPRFYHTPQFFYPALALLFFLPFYQGAQYRKKLKQLDGYELFEEKLPLHESIYVSRMFWLVFMCFSSCFLFMLNAHYIFLYIALFEYFMLLTAFPNKQLMQKELKNDDIIFL